MSNDLIKALVPEFLQEARMDQEGFRGWKKVKNGKNCEFLKHIGKDPRSPYNNDIKLVKTSCAFRGHNENTKSLKQYSFLELIKILACYNDEVAKVGLENALSNSKYTLHLIQEHILHILSRRVKNEANDESKKEQMSFVLRFVDNYGFIQEIFFDLAHVNDNTSLTLKQKVCDILSLHNLDVSNIHGQREVKPIHQFFEKLTLIVNVVCSSTKCHDELQASQLDEKENLLEIGEIVTVTYFVSRKFENEGLSYALRGDADSAYNVLKSFDFIFILHLMKEIMGITNMLYQALQQQSQDATNVMYLVCTTKTLIQELREIGWDELFASVMSFCGKHDIEILDLNDVHSKK
ncbi:uncharacterized protein LOC131639082 [Vicia villosa]|uniref:uncharacterized protein LOC131639082 n=1 Tax=Vicia villosa TaxID=3911 RepID=UPI00273A8F31|nr:uncharacterized protein LOC131639082 [Vicia villosa]